MSRTLSTYLQEDLDQIAGVPDGDLVYIDLIGFEVPSYVDPRYDLIVPGQVAKAPRLEHHVPLALRGPFRPSDLPDRDLWDGETNEEGLCVCNGKRKDGLPCRSAAINRSQFCGTHGGQLHPADKKITKLPEGIVPDLAQVRKMTRVQKVQAGLIPVDELGDDEIAGQFIWNDDGRKVRSRKISDKIHRDMVSQMMARMNDKLALGLPDVLDTVLEIATDPIVEAADRIKASIWWAERVMGKTPDVIIHGKTDAPYEQIFGSLETTSRDAYRNAIESGRVIEGEIVEVGDHGPVRNGATADPNSNGGFGTRLDGQPVDSGEVQDDDEHVLGESDTGSDLDGMGFDGVPVVRVDEQDDDEQASPAANRAAAIGDRRKRLAELKAEQTKAKNRRYAARAQGLAGTSEVGWAIEFRSTGKSGYFHAKLHSPDTITPELLDKIETAEALRSADDLSA